MATVIPKSDVPSILGASLAAARAQAEARPRPQPPVGRLGGRRLAAPAAAARLCLSSAAHFLTHRKSRVLRRAPLPAAVTCDFKLRYKQYIVYMYEKLLGMTVGEDLLLSGLYVHMYSYFKCNYEKRCKCWNCSGLCVETCSATWSPAVTQYFPAVLINYLLKELSIVKLYI